MDLTNLKQTLSVQPKFRLKQINQAIFKDLIQTWQEAKVLPLALREKLNQLCPLEINGKTFVSRDKDTTKALITLEDGQKIETVLMRHDDGRNTVCVSSQVGCVLGCLFCATGKLGFKRNLEAQEIIEQVIFWARFLKEKNAKITNIVFMGMGEPFLNYDNVLAAIKTINDPDGFGLGARRISLSTSGVVEGIKKLAGEPLQINLAISLHAPDDILRSHLMPINIKYPLKELLAAVDFYIKKTNRRVMFEYLLIKDLNDSEECAEKLVKILRGPLRFVNLIMYNATGEFSRSSPEQIQKFKDILKKRGLAFTERFRFGQDIKAACGQLAGRE